MTCAKNGNQHPRNILLEGKQKKHTPEEKQADNAQVEQQRHEQAAEKEHGIKHLANIMDWAEKDEKSLLTQPLKPRLQPCLLLKVPANTFTTSENPGSDLSLTEMDVDGIPGDQGLINGKGSDDVADSQQDLANSEEAPTQAISRRPHSQKSSSRNAVQAAQCKPVDGNCNGDLFGADVSYPYFSQLQLWSNLGPPDLSLGTDTTPDLVWPPPAT